jgi:uncharacterized alpha-E superfamily protein
MLSRIADSLFWMNRYMERAEGMLRLVSSYYILGMDRDTNVIASWKPALELFTTTTEREMTLLEHNTVESLKKIMVEASNENSLKIMVNKARENARGAQDHITKEVWEEINQMYHAVNHSSVLYKLNTFQALEIMEELTRHTVLYAGTIDITMPRAGGWHFMNLGRYVERCLQTIVITEKQLEIMNFSDNDVNDILQWRHLLLSLSGYELHLKTYRSSNHNYNVLHQVLINENFPHSILYSLIRIDHYLNKAINNKMNEDSLALLRTFGKLLSKVKFISLEAFDHTSIQAFLKELKSDLMVFNKQLGQHFFSYS